MIAGRRVRHIAILLIAAAVGTPAVADAADWSSPGKHRIVLHQRSGADIVLGDIVFAAGRDGIAYRLVFDPAATKGYFLSMREFKCIAGADIQCLVPYPYDHPHVVAPDDFAWLEHDLLFLTKSPSEFGAYLTNGLYYALTVKDGALVGSPEDIDLNRIAAPPVDPDVPPYDAAERQPTVRTRWISSLSIERDPH